MTATADPYGGSLYVNAAGDNNPRHYALASAGVDMSGTYVLAGSTGAGTLTLLIDTQGFVYGDQGSIFCTFTVDGTSQTCDSMSPLGGYDLSFAVEYGVPFSIGLQIERIAGANGGEDTGGFTTTYSLSGPGLVETPEPSSILLLLSGVVGVLFVTRLRVTCR